MKEFTFDVYLYTNISVNAKSIDDARKRIERALDRVPGDVIDCGNGVSLEIYDDFDVDMWDVVDDED